MNKDVDTLLATLQRSCQEPFEMVPVTSHVIEVGPAKFGGAGLVKQQTLNVGTGILRKPVQSLQPVDERHVAVVVDGYKPGRHQWRVGCEPAIDRPSRQAKKAGKNGIPQPECPPPVPASRNVVHHGFDKSPRLVAHHEFQDRDIGPGETSGPCKKPEPPRRPIRACLPGLRQGIAQSL